MKDLRATHFDLGTDPKINYESEFAEKYKQWDLTSRSKEVDLMLRKSNIQLKDPFHQQMSDSLYQSDYKTPQNIQKVKLDSKIQADLRTHHFQLGYGASDDQFYQKNQFKPELPTKDQVQDAKSMKDRFKGSMKIWVDPKQYYTTMYQEDYQKSLEELKKASKDSHNTQDIQNHLLKLRSSNILMGTNAPNYTTANSENFSSRAGLDQVQRP
jgi:hypothetical protein